MDRRDFLLTTTLAAAVAAGGTTAAAQQKQPLLQPEPGVNPDRPDVPYEGSKLNRKLQIVNLLDLESEAEKVLPAGGYGYISGGSGANWTRRENTEAFSRVQIEPVTLTGASKVDLTTEILGRDCRCLSSSRRWAATAARTSTRKQRRREAQPPSVR